MKHTARQIEIINLIRGHLEEKEEKKFYWMTGPQDEKDAKGIILKTILSFIYVGDRRKNFPDINITIKW